MDLLNQIFTVYKESNNNKIEAPKQGDSKPPKFGDIVEIYIDNKLLVTVAISGSEVLLMSEFVELGTNLDFIVKINHVIAEEWIIQTNKRIYLTGKETYRINGELSENDKAILKDIIEGKPIPASLCGPKVPPNNKDPRMKFRKEELKKTLLVNKHLFIEEVGKEEGA